MQIYSDTRFSVISVNLGLSVLYILLCEVDDDEHVGIIGENGKYQNLSDLIC